MVSPTMSAGNPKNKDELVSLERQHKSLVDKKGQLEEKVDLRVKQQELVAQEHAGDGQRRHREDQRHAEQR